jgi:hypothetical protein
VVGLRDRALIADQSLRTTEDLHRVVHDMARVARERYAQGRGSQLEVYKAEVEITRLAAELVRLEAMRRSAASRRRIGVLEEWGDLFLLTRVERAADDASACRLDFADQRRQLVTMLPPGEDDEPFGCEFLGNRSADEITGADYGYCSIFVFQVSLLYPSDCPIASSLSQMVLEDFACRACRQGIHDDDLGRALVGCQ